MDNQLARMVRNVVEKVSKNIPECARKGWPIGAGAAPNTTHSLAERPQIGRIEVAGKSPVIGSIPLHGTGPATIELTCVTRFSTAEGVLYQLTATDGTGRRVPSVSRGEFGSQKMLLIPILRRSGDEPRVMVWVPDLPWWSIRLHYRIAIAEAKHHDSIRAELKVRVSRTVTDDPR